MNPSRIFILRPIATSLFMLAILLAGLFSYHLLPVSSLPEVDFPTIQVSTFYPGGSPDVMASSVTAPLERQFGQMPGLNQMASTSSNGSSIITMQFSLDLSLDVAEQEVQEAINAASTYLPAGLPNPPVYNKVNPADTPVVTLALSSKTMPLTEVEDIAETRLAQKISQLSGVGFVSISGGQRPAVRVQTNPNSLAAYGINLEDVRTAIATANVNAAKGSFDGPRLSYTINANDQLLSAEEYRPLIIAYRNNAPVRLSDIAVVSDAAENAKLAAWMNTDPAVIVNIQRQPGANVIQVVDRIKNLLPQLNANLPRAIDLKLLSDRTLTIRSSIHEVEFDLLVSICLVVAVIFLFLRNIPATFIPSVSVPLSLIGTFAFMYLLGFSLNNLTLMALTIATGFVVDDAIVMIENISRFVELGDKPFEAALKGAKQIGFTIMSLTVSLIAVLIPLLFMREVIGRLFREFAITLSVTILISALVSLTLTPMLCARILRHHKEEEQSHFEKKSKEILDRIINQYSTSLRWVLDHQKLTLIVAVITLLITALLFYAIPKGFFPVQDTGAIQGISEAPQTISFQAMADRQQALSKVVLQDPAVENLSSFIGIDGVNTTLNSGRMLITLKPLSDRDASATEVIQRLQSKLMQVPGITLFMQPIQDLTLDDRVSRNQFQYSLGSPDQNEVTHWTNLLVSQLSKSSEVADVTSDMQNLGLQTMITYDRDTASRLGISAQQIDNTLYDAFGQRQVSTMFTQRNQYRVVLEVLPELQLSPSALNNIYIISTVNNQGTATAPSSTANTTQNAAAPSIGNANGIQVTTTNSGEVPLRTFTQIKQQVGPLVINRQGQFPVATVSFNLSPGGSLGSAVNAVEKAVRSLAIPKDMQASFEGTAAAFVNSLSNEGLLLIAAIVVVYIVLGVLYESYIHPITILSTLPSACMGALIALMITGNDLGVITIIGIILLIGIVMKNAIMMIDFALEQERIYGKSPRDAIYEACLLRFRPILMTTMASMLGAVPLAIGTGMGSELRQPLGIGIIGGLIVSQLLTLYTTPVIYLAFDRMSRAFANKISGSAR